MKSHPFADLFPMMGDDMLADLAESIKANGLRDEIVTYKGAILDGRNRYLACKKAGIKEPPTTEYTGDDPLGFVIEKNLLRRDLTIGQRAMISVKLATIRQGERTDLNGDGEHCANLRKVDQRQAAKIMGVGRNSVIEAKAVVDRGTKEEIEAVTSGKEAPSRAAKIIREKEAEIREAAKSDPERFGKFAERLKAGEKAAIVHKAFTKEKNRTTTKGEEIKDHIGQPIPDHLKDLFGDPWLNQMAQELETIFRDTIKSMKRRVEKKGTRYKFLLCGEILKSFDSAYTNLEIAHSHLLEGRPHAVCPKCEGKGCKLCRSEGWLPRWRLKELKSSGEI